MASAGDDEEACSDELDFEDNEPGVVAAVGEFELTEEDIDFGKEG